MPATISITDFRKNLFSLADELSLRGGTLLVTKRPNMTFEFKSLNAQLATGNQKHFSQIPGLKFFHPRRHSEHSGHSGAPRLPAGRKR